MWRQLLRQEKVYDDLRGVQVAGGLTAAGQLRGSRWPGVSTPLDDIRHHRYVVLAVGVGRFGNGRAVFYQGG